MSISGEKYILDTNVFIEAARRYYPLDFAKPFWNWLVAYAEKDIVFSVDKVYDEIKDGSDELKEWAEESFRHYFLSTKNEEILNSYAIIVSWVQEQTQFTQNAKNRFMDKNNADAWVLAYALTYDTTIVTHETSNLYVQKRIPIPNVCDAFDLDYCNTFDMLRILNFSF